jgi:hypothetical protein
VLRGPCKAPPGRLSPPTRLSPPIRLFTTHPPWQIARILFIHAYNLPENFNFATYIWCVFSDDSTSHLNLIFLFVFNLSKGIDHNIVELMDIDEVPYIRPPDGHILTAFPFAHHADIVGDPAGGHLSERSA